MSAQLATRLRAGTHDLHRQVERMPFVAALIAGRLARQPYTLLLRNLEPIYRTLEQALNARRQDPSVAPICLPTLFRADALAADLQWLAGPSGPALAVLPEAADYVAHLQALQRAQPQLLAAHAYVRYLGDLNGGQMLGRIVRRALALPDPGTSGTRFYDFGGAFAVQALAAAFRAGLEALPTPDDAIVEEAQRAFGLHLTLFEALARHTGLGATSVVVDETADRAVEVGRATG